MKRAQITQLKWNEDSERGDMIAVCKCMEDLNIQKEGSYLGLKATLAQNQTDIYWPSVIWCWSLENVRGGRFCNILWWVFDSQDVLLVLKYWSLILLGMSTCDTWTSWQKGRGRKGNERRGWMIQDVLVSVLSCPLSSSLFGDGNSLTRVRKSL